MYTKARKMDLGAADDQFWTVNLITTEKRGHAAPLVRAEGKLLEFLASNNKN
jgi:hypothetical protein